MAWFSQRKHLLFSQLSGDVVEIGAGAGANFRHLPPSVRAMTVVEPNEALLRKARAAAHAAGIELRAHIGEAEHLPLPDASADAVIATWVLCTGTTCRAQHLAFSHPRYHADGGHRLCVPTQCVTHRRRCARWRACCGRAGSWCS
jgi:SAM-dependent methyltransferase